MIELFYEQDFVMRKVPSKESRTDELLLTKAGIDLTCSYLSRLQHFVRYFLKFLLNQL